MFSNEMDPTGSYTASHLSGKIKNLRAALKIALTHLEAAKQETKKGAYADTLVGVFELCETGINLTKSALGDEVIE